MADDQWFEPHRVLDMLLEAGAQMPEAWHITKEAMQQGRIRCLAASITSYFVGEPRDSRTDTEVPCDAWVLSAVPSLGYSFWRTGNVNLTIHVPGSQAIEQALSDELSLAPVSPIVEVRGARLDRAGAELLRYERALRGDPVGGEAEGPASRTGESTKKHNISKRLGRTPGAGTYTSVDAPLVSEMERLIADQEALSVHHAAKLVATRARGGGTDDSKAARLARAYRAWKRDAVD